MLLVVEIALYYEDISDMTCISARLGAVLEYLKHASGKNLIAA